MIDPIGCAVQSGFLPEGKVNAFVERIRALVEKIKMDSPKDAQERSMELLSKQKIGSEYLKAAYVIYSIFPHLNKEKEKFKIGFSDGDVELSQDELEALKKDSGTINDMMEDSEGQIVFSLINKKTFEVLLKRLYNPDKSEIDLDLILCANYLNCRVLLNELKQEIKQKVYLLKKEDLEKAYQLNNTLPPFFQEILDKQLAYYFGNALEKAENPSDLIQQYRRNKVYAISILGNISECLLKALENISLRKLKLKYCENLADTSHKSFPSSLKTLSLQNSSITNIQFSHLCTLTSLDLSCTKISDEGIKSISLLTSLIFLNLQRNFELTDIGLKYIDSLKSITSLNLSFTKTVDVGVFSSLTSLTVLSLVNTQVTCVTHLRAMPALTSLDLEKTIIASNELASISALSRLETLNVSWSKIDDNRMALLYSLNAITSLDLSNTKIKDLGVARLDRLTSLTSLDLSGNKISDLGITPISSLTSLTSLNLAHNKIKDLSFVRLDRLTSLTSLDLSGNKISDLGITPISSLTSLTSLNIGYNKIRNFRLGQLSILTSLNTLDLSENRISDIEPVQHNALTSLGLRATKISDRSLINFSKLTSLAFLDLRGSKITNNGLLHLHLLTSLKTLN